MLGLCKYHQRWLPRQATGQHCHARPSSCHRCKAASWSVGAVVEHSSCYLPTCAVGASLTCHYPPFRRLTEHRPLLRPAATAARQLQQVQRPAVTGWLQLQPQRLLQRLQRGLAQTPTLSMHLCPQQGPWTEGLMAQELSRGLRMEHSNSSRETKVAEACWHATYHRRVQETR